MFSTLKLLKAKSKLKKLKKYITEQNLMILGKKFRHETKLIDILAVEYVFISRLDKKIIARNKEVFELFLRMQAHAILAADLVNEGAEKVIVGYKWRSMNELIKKISKDEPELGKLSKAHWNMANKLLAEVEKTTQKKISKDFEKAVSKGLSYLRKELEFSARLCAGEVRFAKSFIKKQFAKDETLAHLTYDRVSVIFEFLIESFYNLFLEENNLKEYPKEQLIEWAVKISLAMQEGIDDIDDIENDIPKLKPTPLILRILHKGSVDAGTKDSKIWNMNYMNSVKTLKVMPELKKIGNRIQRSIKKRYKKLLRKRKKIELLISRYFSCLV